MIADEDLVIPEFAKGCVNLTEGLINSDRMAQAGIDALENAVRSLDALSSLKALSAKTATNIIGLAVSRRGRPAGKKMRPELEAVRAVLSESLAVLDEVLEAPDD